MGRPRPVPLSAITASWRPWPKLSNTFSCSSGAMPTPVSSMPKDSEPSASTLAKAVTRPPGGVNLIAFEARLTSIWRSARSSA